MVPTNIRLLIVDDEPAIRTVLSLLFANIGYSVRLAEDGFSALSQIRQEPPEVLLSDLNMPGMCGFELLSVVRRQFPAIHRIAMSGAYSGSEVPVGVDADAFYEKGSNMGALLLLLSTSHKAMQPALQPFLINRPASLPHNNDPARNRPSLNTGEESGRRVNPPRAARPQCPV